MGWYKCKDCEHEFHAGFFNRSNYARCPKCWGKFSQVFGVIKTILKIAIPLGIIFAIFSCAAPNVSKKALSHVTAALDSTTLYAYSKDAYVESVIRGRQANRYYLIGDDLPYYSSILSKAKLDSAEPLGVLPVKTAVELGSAIRRGSEVWIPVSFYIEDKPQQAFALFPREWEEQVSVYDWDGEVNKIKEAYQTFVKTNFELMEVEPKNEKEYKEKYNDYYKVRGIGDKTFFYALKTDKPHIDSAYSYYLGRSSINSVLLQMDKEWERPALEFKKPASNETEEKE